MVRRVKPQDRTVLPQRQPQRSRLALEFKSLQPPLSHLALHRRQLSQREVQILNLRLGWIVVERIVVAATAAGSWPPLRVDLRGGRGRRGEVLVVVRLVAARARADLHPGASTRKRVCDLQVIADPFLAPGGMGKGTESLAVRRARRFVHDEDWIFFSFAYFDFYMLGRIVIEANDKTLDLDLWLG